MEAIIFVLVVAYVVLGLRVVHPHERIAVFRAGRFSHLIEPGLHWRNPLSGTSGQVRLDLDQVLPDWRGRDLLEIRNWLSESLASDHFRSQHHIVVPPS